MKKPTNISVYVFNESLKRLKKNIGAKCVHLANRLTLKGERQIDVTLLIEGKKQKFIFSLPFLLTDIKMADYEYLEDLIKSKLN